MQRRVIILTTLLVALLALAALASAEKSYDAVSTGTMASGDAVIELRPTIRGNGELVVKFAANTHSVDLSRYDLKEAAALLVDGEVISPSKADRLRGHHSFGKVVFNPGRDVKGFKITIKGIPADMERVYEWREN